jgi:hypothetical protein
MTSKMNRREWPIVRKLEKNMKFTPILVRLRNFFTNYLHALHISSVLSLRWMPQSNSNAKSCPILWCGKEWQAMQLSILLFQYRQHQSSKRAVEPNFTYYNSYKYIGWQLFCNLNCTIKKCFLWLNSFAIDSLLKPIIFHPKYTLYWSTDLWDYTNILDKKQQNVRSVNSQITGMSRTMYM